MSKDQIIAGLNSVRSALAHGAGSVQELWVERRQHNRRVKEIMQLASAADVQINQVSRDKLDELAQGANHQGVVASTQAPAALDEGALKSIIEGLEVPPFLLILDGVQDPHNLGACLRSADAAGVHAVIVPKDRSAGLGPTVCKVACGAAESVPFITVTNLARVLRWLQQEAGVWLIGTAGETESSLYEVDLKGPLALVMGGEEKGMRRLTREACDTLVSLPMAGRVSSLNVSVATGICLYEAVRQRGLSV